MRKCAVADGEDERMCGGESTEERLEKRELKRAVTMFVSEASLRDSCRARVHKDAADGDRSYGCDDFVWRAEGQKVALVPPLIDGIFCTATTATTRTTRMTSGRSRCSQERNCRIFFFLCSMF